MKKLLLSLVFIGIGSGAWWVLSRTASLSVKKWDAKFESIFRNNLSQMGLTDHDIVSSVHQVKKDSRGEYIFYQTSLSLADLKKKEELIKDFRQAGAQVEEKAGPNRQWVLLIKKGPRIYQEIKILPR